MSIAEELRRERAEQRAAADRDPSDPRGIDALDSLESLEALDWASDPWDDTGAAPTVERLRWQTRSIKWVAYLAMTVVVVLILTAGLIGWWYVRQTNPDGETGDAVSFTVAAEETLDSLSERLERRGLVVDAGVFRWYVEQQGGLELTPGYYEIATSDHMGNVLARLRTPPAETYNKVTFPEGFTAAQIAERVDAEVVPMTAEGFNEAMASPDVISAFRPPGVTSLEGLLFPDTYQVSNGETEAAVINRMITQMERVAGQEDIVTKSERLFQTPYGILIIASMIEREAKTAADRPKIARVIYNRLAAEMTLSIDAAVRYGTLLDGGDPDVIPFVEQRNAMSPYNTYLVRGLPPTPIANPGRDSIRAALNPAPDPSVGDPLCADLPEGTPCKYYYYVLADLDGNHKFAVTAEQNAADIQAASAAGLLD
ncbi:MAG: endolytic transglycosylase MltG [Ilumatobacteraceae bacterium]